MDDLDKLTSPKGPSLGCEQCPFASVCGDMCVLGYEVIDEDGAPYPYLPQSVAS